MEGVTISPSAMVARRLTASPLLDELKVLVRPGEVVKIACEAVVYDGLKEPVLEVPVGRVKQYVAREISGKVLLKEVVGLLRAIERVRRIKEIAGELQRYMEPHILFTCTTGVGEVAEANKISL